MGNLIQSIKELGPQKLAALGGVAILLLGFFIFLATRSNETGSYAPLYSGLDMKDSAQIVQELDKTQVPYRLEAGGSMIMVPSDQVLKLRMNMAQAGLPDSGSIVGYEIFDRTDKLGTSNFIHNVNMLRALEGELARTIGSFNKIDSARVHLVLPKREVFSRERQQPKASVMLTMRGGNQLSKGEIQAIRHLVATAVPELDLNQITITDNKGQLLARGGDDEEMGYLASTALEYRVNYENRTRDRVESVLARILGDGHVRAEVTADIDFDRVVRNSETFDPDGQVARSVQTSEEREESREKDLEENVSVGNQLPDAEADNAGMMNLSTRAMTDEVTNYEISKVVENHIRETGSVRRLSVAVLVDGVYAPDAEGNMVYTPRSTEELDKIATLVRSAVGYDESRGDVVEVINMQFSDGAGAQASEGPLDWLRDDLQGIIQTLVIGIVAILAILLIIRPIVNRVIEVSSAREEEEDEALAEHLALLGPDLAALTDQRGTVPELSDNRYAGEDEEMIDIDRIQGKVRGAAVKRVQEILENSPEEAIGALRRWMDDRGQPA